MAEKVWIANKHINTISHRALTTYERRNPHIFALGRSAHATEAEALAVMVGYRRDALASAKKRMASAERALAKALSMQKGAGNA